MKRLGLRLGLGLLAAVTIGAAPAPPIGMTIHSWGREVAIWRIEPDGAIVSTRMAETDSPASSKRYALITRRTTAVPARYREIARLLRSARALAGRTMKCSNPTTDAPSGQVSWGEAKLDYYAGCRDAKTQAVINRLFDANKRIEAWANEAPVVATRIVGQEEPK